MTSIHLPRTRSVPSPLFHAQFCALVPLHVQIWIGVPLFALAPASSRHLPPLPRIGVAPRYFALTTDGVSRLYPASIDWARRRDWPSAELSGEALPVGRPSSKQETFDRSQICSATK